MKERFDFLNEYSINSKHPIFNINFKLKPIEISF